MKKLASLLTINGLVPTCGQNQIFCVLFVIKSRGYNFPNYLLIYWDLLILIFKLNQKTRLKVVFRHI